MSHSLKASIDLGTNTCLLLIRDADQGGASEKILHDESTVVRLGQGVGESGVLHADAMARAFECLSRYAETVKKHSLKPSDVIAVGTAQARDAKNASDFFTRIEKDLGFKFKVLSGDQEAQATFVGAALPGMDPQKMAVMDIGGGSTELVSYKSGKSLNFGAVKISEKYLKSDPVTDQEFWACESAIDQALQEMLPWRKTLSHPMFVAVAGTAVTLAMIQLAQADYDRTKIDGLKLSNGDVHRIVEELKWRSVEERKKMIGMEVKRADVILAGALIFWRVMEVLDFKEVTISTRGLRYGVQTLF